jgi:hypothetical protein
LSYYFVAHGQNDLLLPLGAWESVPVWQCASPTRSSPGNRVDAQRIKAVIVAGRIERIVDRQHTVSTPPMASITFSKALI